MKTKVDKKAKKRSVSKASLSIKPNQKQKTVTAFKKGIKKAKLGLIQNGNSTMENKLQILKKMYKQKEKPKIKQTNAGLLAEIKTEGGTKLPIAKRNEESIDKNTKELKLKNLQIKQVKRELRKKRRRRKTLPNAASITLSIEEIEAKIEEIRNREVLSKRAKKFLAVLNRKLRLEKSALDKSEKINIIEKKGNKKNQKVGAFVKTESVSNKNNKDKIKIKKEHVEHETIKQEKDQNDSNVMVTENDEDEAENDEDQSDTEPEESMQDTNEQFDDKSEDEEDEDTEDDEEDEEDEDDKNDDYDEETYNFKLKKEFEEKPKTQAKQSLEHQKKNRYVLFVGNLPTDVTADELKQHFLTKVDTVSNVRIPIKSDTKTPRGFAFVEVTNTTDFEKGLSLHHTIIKKRRIIVKSNDNKKTNIGRNFGINRKKVLKQTFQKAKKLASGNQGKKKPLKK